MKLSNNRIVKIWLSLILFSTGCVSEKAFVSESDENIANVSAEDTVDAFDENLVSASEEDTINIPEEGITNASDEDFIIIPDEATVSPSEEAFVSEFDENISSAFDEDTIVAPEEDIVVESEEGFAIASAEDSVIASDEDVVVALNEDFVSESAEDIVSESVENSANVFEEDIVSVPEEAPVSAFEEDVASSLDEDIATAAEEDLVSESGVDAVIASEEDVVSVSDETTVNVSEEDIVSVPEEAPVSTFEEDVVSPLEEDLATAAEEDLVSESAEDIDSELAEETVNTSEEATVVESEEVTVSESDEEIVRAFIESFKTEKKDLSLEQARALALTSNLDIKSQMQAYWATSDTVEAETWIYEPEFQLVARQQITDRDNNVAQRASTNRPFIDQEETLYNARLQNLLPSGGSIALDYRLTDRVNNQGGQNNIFGGGLIPGENLRQFETFLGITFTQPLLRKENIENLGEQNPQNPRMRIQLAEKTSEIAFQQVRFGLSKTIAQVEVAYWNLYSALQVKKLREESLEVAKDIYSDNKERFRLGKMAKLELLQSESEIADRETKLEEAKKRLHIFRNELNTFFSKSLMCEDFSFTPIDEPQIFPIVQTCEEVAAISFLNHPEYLIRKEQAELEGLKLAYAKNQRLPQLDLTLTYGFNGLGTSANEAWQQVEDKSKADWFAGVQLNIPILGDRKAHRQMTAAKRKKQQAIMNMKATELQILNLTITTYKRLKSNFNTYEKSSQVVSFREELLDAELAKLMEGKSSSRQVFEIESELSDSKINKLEKMVEYQKAQIELMHLQGIFLKERNIDISEDQLLN